MSFPSLKSLILTGTVALGLSSVHATTLGLPDANRRAIWDTFTAVNFTGQAPDSTSGTLFSATLGNQHTEGTGVLMPPAGPGPKDRIYGGSFAGVVGAFNFTLQGTAAGSITSLSVVIKFTSPGEVPNTAENYFTLSMAGNPFLPAPVAVSAPLDEGGNQFNLLQWTWTGLNLEDGDTFTIIASSALDHVSVDAIQLAAIPEPSTYLMIFAGAGALLAFQRRKRLA